MQGLGLIITISILILSTVVHEWAHGFTAYKLGDPTAKLSGRLTLNPIKHLDFVGSFIVPTVCFIIGGFIFGWARPVPYNPYNLRSRKWGEIAVAAAGPASNLIIALFFGLITRFYLAPTALAGELLPLGISSGKLLGLFESIVLVNIMLAIFNLIPIPPLDGSKIFWNLLPLRFRQWRERAEGYYPIIFFVLVLFLWQFIVPVVGVIFDLIVGR